MATTDVPLPVDHVKALDTLRSRLAQASASIALLKQQLEHSDPLPPWPSLQTNAASVEYNLRQVHETMAEHSGFLATAHAYPLPTFPGSTQDGLLQTLLRKKLEPRSEDWIEENLQEEKLARLSGGVTRFDSGAQRDLWKWAQSEADRLHWELEEQDAFRDNFTIAERHDGAKKVVTGIKRNLDAVESDNEEDDNDSEKMQVDGDEQKNRQVPIQSAVQRALPSVPLESLLAFASSGLRPP